MSHRVAGFTLIAAGLAGFVLEHLKPKGPDGADVCFSFTPKIDCPDLGLSAGDSYTLDPTAPVYLGDTVAVLDTRNTIMLTPYCDELLLLCKVVGLVVRV